MWQNETMKTKFQHLIRDYGAVTVAEKAGVSVSTVHKWSGGFRDPKPEMVRDVLGPAFGVDYADVYGPVKDTPGARV